MSNHPQHTKQIGSVVHTTILFFSAVCLHIYSPFTLFPYLPRQSISFWHSFHLRGLELLVIIISTSSLRVSKFECPLTAHGIHVIRGTR